MLAPDPAATIGQLTSIFNSTSLVTSWVHALEDADLRPLDPAPAWYQSINTTLGTAQQSSMSWLTTTGPQVQAGISQSFIDYANFFVPAAAQLGTLVAEIQQGGNVPTAGQQAELKTLADALSTRAATGQKTVQDLLAALSAYRMQMGAIHDSLVSAMSSAMALEEADRQAIGQVQLKIADIQQKIAALTTQASSSTVSADTTLFGMIISFTFGLALSGGTLALGGFAVAILSIGAAAVKSEIYGSELQADFEELTALMGELAEDQQQLAMVQGVIGNLATLLDTNDEALENFTAFTYAWDFTVQGLDALGVVLDQPRIDVSRIPDLLSLPGAVTDWQKVAAFAQQVQDAKLQVAGLDLPPVTTAQPALRAV